MKKNKQRNELSIFEDFKLKPKIKEVPLPQTTKYMLENLDILCEMNKDKTPVGFWKEKKNGDLIQDEVLNVLDIIQLVNIILNN